MKQRYNLVLLPKDKEQHAAFIRHARQQADKADGYMLSTDNGLPHVTLCQFYPEIDEASQLSRLFTDMAKTLALTEGVTLRLCQPYTTPGSNDGNDNHEGKIWWAQDVHKSPQLEQMQTTAVQLLQMSRATTLTKSGDKYRPHVTFGRFNMAEMVGNLSLDAETPIANGQAMQCRLALGRSSNNGQLLDIIYTL